MNPHYVLRPHLLSLPTLPLTDLQIYKLAISSQCCRTPALQYLMDRFVHGLRQVYVRAVSLPGGAEPLRAPLAALMKYVQGM